MTEPILCKRCGAPVPAGAAACGFCGVSFAGAPPPSPAFAPEDAEIVALIEKNNLIGAIKAHRTRHASSLLDAKAAVEAMAARIRGRR